MEYNGIINIYKEAGYTSHDVVAKLRGMLHQKKIGHTGTLDPDAEGVLPVCLGKATKLCGMLSDHEKEYEAVLLLGKDTDTQDAGGRVLAEKPVEVSEEEIRRCAASFVGEQLQVPPMYSARKVNGKRLYELAREGQVVERKPGKVHFYQVEILSIQLPRVKLRIRCSAGTYIRTLCHDMGEKLGCGGCMEHLLRTRVERFGVLDARKLSQVQMYADHGKVQLLILPTDRMFEEYAAVKTGEKGDRLVHNGNPFPTDLAEGAAEAAEGRFRVYDSQDIFVGIFSLEDGLFRPVKMFL